MAREVNGSNQLLYTNGTPVTSSPATLAGFGYTDTLTGKRCLLNVNHENGATGFSHFSLGMDGGNDKAYFQASSGTDRTAVAAITSTVSTWQHYAGSEIASNSRAVWLEGGNKGTETTSVTFGMTPTQVVLGTWSRGLDASVQLFDRWDGRLAELAIYNDALTDMEVATLAAGFKPISVRSANCVAYWPLWGFHDPEVCLSLVNTTRYSANLVNSPTSAVHPDVLLFSERYWKTCAFLEPLAANLKQFSESLALSGADVLKTINKNLTASLSLAGQLVKSVSKGLTGTLSLVEDLFVTTNKLLAASLSLSANLVKNPSRTFSNTLDLVGSLTKTTSKFFSNTLDLAGSLATSTGKLFLANLTLDSSLVKTPTKLFSDVLTLVGTLTKGFSLSFSATLSLTAILTRNISRILLGSLSLTGSLIKSIFKQIAGLLGLEGLFTKTGGTIDPDTLPPVIPDLVDFTILQASDQISFTRQISDQTNFTSHLTDKVNYT